MRKALEVASEGVDESSAEDSSTGFDTPRQRQADALVAMAESFLASGPVESRGDDRHLGVVNVDADVLATDAEGRCELDDGPAIATEVARRLSCDAAVVGGVSLPGLEQPALLHGHHVKHWSRDGATSLANLVHLCPTDHRAVHEEGYCVEAAVDPAHHWVFRHPDGRIRSSVLPPGERLDLGFALDALFSRKRRA